jgi:hypothetical protein
MGRKSIIQRNKTWEIVNGKVYTPVPEEGLEAFLARLTYVQLFIFLILALKGVLLITHVNNHHHHINWFHFYFHSTYQFIFIYLSICELLSHLLKRKLYGSRKIVLALASSKFLISIRWMNEDCQELAISNYRQGRKKSLPNYFILKIFFTSTLLRF